MQGPETGDPKLPSGDFLETFRGFGVLGSVDGRGDLKHRHVCVSERAKARGGYSHLFGGVRSLRGGQGEKRKKDVQTKVGHHINCLGVCQAMW